jgi:hypothetical protein
MLTERSGTLQQCIEDRPALQQHNMAWCDMYKYPQKILALMRFTGSIK